MIQERLTLIGESSSEELRNFGRYSGLLFMGCFPIVKPGASMKELKLRRRDFLKRQGLEDIEIVACNSREDQLSKMFAFYVKFLPNDSDPIPKTEESKPYLWIIEDNPEEIFKTPIKLLSTYL